MGLICNVIVIRPSRSCLKPVQPLVLNAHRRPDAARQCRRLHAEAAHFTIDPRRAARNLYSRRICKFNECGCQFQVVYMTLVGLFDYCNIPSVGLRDVRCQKCRHFVANINHLFNTYSSNRILYPGAMLVKRKFSIYPPTNTKRSTHLNSVRGICGRRGCVT